MQVQKWQAAFLTPLFFHSAFFTQSIKRWIPKINLKSKFLWNWFQIFTGSFIRKMNYCATFSALKVNMIFAMIFFFWNLIYEAIRNHRLMLYQQTIFRHPVKISVHRCLIYINTFFFQKLQNIPRGKILFFFCFNKLGNEIRCFCMIRLLQHGCNLSHRHTKCQWVSFPNPDYNIAWNKDFFFFFPFVYKHLTIYLWKKFSSLVPDFPDLQAECFFQKAVST